MIRKQFLISLFILGFAFNVFAVEVVKFEGNDKTQSGEQLMLTGKLRKPKGGGPFPAVVMLHGILGIEKFKKSYDIWAKRLASWGYVSLQVDSFGPRGNPDVALNIGLVSLKQRAQDAHDAKSYLTGLPFVNRNQIAIIGWSHGGMAVLVAIDEGVYMQNRGDPFRLAIAFYPLCTFPLRGLNAPLLILGGELDGVCPPQTCYFKMPSGKTPHEIILKIYPQAYHIFDFEGEDAQKVGCYNPAATDDAVEQISKFFEKHLK